jgi:hypothetical protein
LKENIMIGKLIPAGTGFEPGQFSDETPGEQPSGEMLEGRVLDLFEDEVDDFLDDDDLEDVDEDLYEDEDLEEDAAEEDELEEDLDDDELEIIE